MKKLIIGFDGTPHGSLCAINGRLHIEGKNPDAVAHHVEAAIHSLMHRNQDVTAESVLDHLSRTLQGRTHAQWESDDRPDRTLKALETLPAPQAIALAARLTGAVNLRTRDQAIAAFTKALGVKSNHGSPE